MALSDLLPFGALPPLAPRSRWGILFIAAVVAVVNPTANGYDSSMMGSILALNRYRDQFHINDRTSGLNNGSMFIGLFLSVPFITYFSDTFGRKKAIVFATVIMVIAIIIMVTANNIGQFIFARIFYGIGAGITGGAAPTLVAELCPAHLRARILGVYHSCYYVGALMASGVTYGSRDIESNWSWRLPILIVLAPTVLCIACLYFCPESPRWLIMHDRQKEALEILDILNAGNKADVTAIQADIHASLDAEKTIYDSATIWKEMISSRANLRRIFIMCSLGLMCEMSGNSIGTYYFTVLLEQAGVKNVGTQLQVGMIRSAFCLVCSLIGCLTLDLIGRKVQAFASMIGIIVSMFILGALVKLYGNSANISGQYGAIAMMFTLGGAYSWCFTPIMCIYPPEVFPNRTRALGTAIFTFFSTSSGILATFLFPIGMSNIGYKFYFVIGAYDFIFIPMIIFAWVESKKMPLEKVADLFGDGEQALARLEDTGSVRLRQTIVVEAKSMD